MYATRMKAVPITDKRLPTSEGTATGRSTAIDVEVVD
jgi:hypothetical protein